MNTLYGTDADDTLDYSNEASGYNVDALGGNDVVDLNDQAFVSNTGNDTVIGNGETGYALWYAPERAYIDLRTGVAQDGFGGVDQLSGINTVHMTWRGGDIYGSDNDETVFYFGGESYFDMGAGSDHVRMWDLSSSDFTIRQTGNTTYVRHKEYTLTLLNAEKLSFSDYSINLAIGAQSGQYLTKQTLLHSFVETEQSPGWWYEGVYSEPQTVGYFPQAGTTIDIDADGDLDYVMPLNRGYRGNVDTRYHFQVFENDAGKLIHSESRTSETPFITGSRRTETIYIERYASEAVVTTAHDTAGEGETRTDIPWRLGDISILLANPFTDVTSELIPTDTLPQAAYVGRDTAVDSHSMACGDIDGDGLDDILVGDWGGTFILCQTLDGAFEYSSPASLRTLVKNEYLDPDLPAATSALTLDLHLGDFDGDGSNDLVVGRGHGTAFSRIYFNDGQGNFSANRSEALPLSVYGADDTLHMRTFSEDFDKDGDEDLLILQTRYDPYYGGNYLQLLENDGEGNFTDITATHLVDPNLYPDTFMGRLNWTDFWQVIDLDGDSDLDIVGHRAEWSLGSSPIFFLNDGTGKFDVDYLPAGNSSRPLGWSDYDGDGLLEAITHEVHWLDAEGASISNEFYFNELVEYSSENSRAFDLHGNAGKVAKILGAVFGSDSVASSEYAGIGLSLVDGGMSYEALAEEAIGVTAARSPSQICELLWENVVGTPATLDEIAPFVQMLDDQAISVAQLVVLAADTALNAQNIDLAGLAEIGLEYTPFG